MIAILDVQYSGKSARSGLVLIKHWTDSQPASTFTRTFSDCTDYQPGQFYKRELPVLLDILEHSPLLFQTVIVDAHVYLKQGEPGLGRYLFDALDGNVSVVGVAKSQYCDSQIAVQVTRGKSQQPLFVTAEGLDHQTAADHVVQMHGPYRIPSMLKLADQIARGHTLTSASTTK